MKLTRRTRLIALLTALCATAGCPRDERTALVVEVRAAGFQAGVDLDEVLSSVDGKAATMFPLGSGSGQMTFPLRFGVLPTKSASEVVTVEVVGRWQGSDRVKASARLGFVKNETRLLVITLEAGCADVWRSCSAEQTCRAGSCDSNQIDVTTLPPLGSEPMAVTPDADVADAALASDGAAADTHGIYDAVVSVGVDAALPIDAVLPCTDGDKRVCSCGANVGGMQSCSKGKWEICTISCAANGLMGKCAAGIQLCDTAKSQWAACSVTAAPADTCAKDNDDNCNGTKNEGCHCVTGQTQSCDKSGLFGKCATGTQLCDGAGNWGACSILPAAADSCTPGNDDNCNGQLNDNCPCLEGASRPCKDGGLMGKCANGTQTCSQSKWSACSIAPSSADTCTANNDDNCNGIKNEGCECKEGQTRTCAEGNLVGKCSTGTETCTAAGHWGPCSILPSANDSCVLGNDDNCNGKNNEGCSCLSGMARPCADAGLKGTCAGGTQQCDTGGKWGACSIAPASRDSCAANNDDNCNGIKNEGCACLTGTTRSCAADTGGNTKGPCAAGTETCNSAGQWGACSIQPKSADNCDGQGSDDTCDGVLSCACSNGDSRACNGCGDSQTCTNGVWSTCASCCPTVINDRWSSTAPVSYTSTPWKIIWPPESSPAAKPTTNDGSGGTLVLPRDTVLTRDALPGGFVVTFWVLLEDAFAFQVDFAGGLPFPALRRVGTAQTTLGGLKYGTLEGWRSYGDWADQGTGGSTQVTLYVKANGTMTAAGAGTPAIMSGFVACPGADSKLFRLIGSNSNAYKGSLKTAKVSNLAGCAGLTDSQVDALYLAKKTY